MIDAAIRQTGDAIRDGEGRDHIQIVPRDPNDLMEKIPPLLAPTAPRKIPIYAMPPSPLLVPPESALANRARGEPMVGSGPDSNAQNIRVLSRRVIKY
jgi:hypothetical protein